MAENARREPSGESANVWRLLPASRAKPSGGETLNRSGAGPELIRVLWAAMYETGRLAITAVAMIHRSEVFQFR